MDTEAILYGSHNVSRISARYIRFKKTIRAEEDVDAVGTKAIYRSPLLLAVWWTCFRAHQKATCPACSRIIQ